MDIVSNSLAGSGNQCFFTMPKEELRTGRIFYKITCGGTFRYSLLFSDTVDTTFADGTVSKANKVCGDWTIYQARVGRYSSNVFADDPTAFRGAEPSEWHILTFGGQFRKDICAGACFSSDLTVLTFEKGDYLCLELTFSGTELPCHEESLLPAFLKRGDEWIYSKQMPFAGRIGCERTVRARIGFLGDSITQGIGTAVNSYRHWTALLADKLGDNYAYWNLGLGFAKASDAASGGAWFSKALQNDVLFVCLGVNDLLQGKSGQQIAKDLTKIVTLLKQNGKAVILQTLPPFDYIGKTIQEWETVNTYIKATLFKRVDLVFDNVPILGMENGQAHMAKYGGHPNEEGCAAWADALYRALFP